MTRKGLVSLAIATALSLIVTITGTQPAAAELAPVTAPSLTLDKPPASCSAPPDSPDATTDNRDRFIRLWAPRLADKAWFDTFVNLGAVPTDIAAEGFHAMDKPTKAWLIACMVDNLVATAGSPATVAEITKYQLGLYLVVFNKAQIAAARDKLASTQSKDVTPAEPVPTEFTANALTEMAAGLSGDASLTSVLQPKADATPSAASTSDLSVDASAKLKALADTQPPTKIELDAQADVQAPALQNNDPEWLSKTLSSIINAPPVALLLKAVAELQKLVGKIQEILFTVPGVNLLATAFYKVCAESATQPLACSVMLPIGVPSAVDVNGDNFPDVLANLLPQTGGLISAVGAAFSVTRLPTTVGPLPAHVFVVYDPGIVKKRIEFGFDGRASTLADNANAKFMLHNPFAAVVGDVEVSATVSSTKPGATESLTFAVKSLVGGSIGVPASEADPVAGAVQFSPFPAKFGVNARMMHGSQDRDIFTVESATPSTVNALIEQRTTTTTPQSNRRFTATVDKLPTSVTVDLMHQGETQNINYTASAPIGLVRASDTAVGDVSKPGSYTHSVYEVKGVPTSVNVRLQGAQDILYNANVAVPEVTFSTQTYKDTVLQQQITAQAHQIPSSVHVTDTTTADQSAITYDANAVLPDVSFTMYDLVQDQTNLIASATAIPTHMEFTQTKGKGVFDFAANDGIGQINASLTRGGGTVMVLPGDHATVYKRALALGLHLQLSGFKSAHFDGSEKTILGLGLSPGGQSFDALADLDEPNVEASVHVSQLPATMDVTIDPVAGSAMYAASSIIPDLHGSFEQRDTQTLATLKFTDLPKNIALTFNTTGKAPQITYTADSRLGSIEGSYQAAPGGLGFHALISDLPQYMLISGQDPIVFDARNAAGDPSGSSYLGQVLFQYTTDGTFDSPPTTDDHLYLKTTGNQTRAEVLYSGLKFLSVNTSNQELHAEIRNASPRLMRAYLTTPTVTLTGSIDKVPAVVQLDQVGNKVTYQASSPIAQIVTALNRTNGDAIGAIVRDVPGKVEVVFDGSGINWNATAKTGSFTATASLTAATLNMPRGLLAALVIKGIPTQWSGSWANGNVLFQAGAPGIEEIAVGATNHNSIHTLPGDHLAAYYDQPSGDLDASLRISNLTKAGFTKLTNNNGGGFVADLNMGNHGAFGLWASVNDGTNKLSANGGFDTLPAQLNLRSDGGRIQYTGDTNPTLTLSVAAGDLAALPGVPAPPSVHGLAIRDGASASGKAVKANLYLTGLPTSLDLNAPAGTYTVGNYNPSIDTLVVDAKLNTLAPQPLTLQLQQSVGASPVNFTFGPFLTSTAADGTHALSLNYTASRAMGALTAEATYGNTDDAKLTISQIPASISVNAAFGEQKTVNISMSQGISDITAAYKKVGAASFAASVHLHDVPSAVNLVLGRGQASGGGKTVTAPDFTFTTSQAGMDIDAYASADIVTPADITAAAQLQVTNLGHTVTGGLEGTSLHITSAPATGSFLLTAAGTVDIPPISLDFGDGGGGLNNDGELEVHVNVKQLTLGFENASDLNLDLGITTGLHGNFSKFYLGEDTDTTIKLRTHMTLDIDWPDPLGTSHIVLIDIPQTTINLGNVISSFHLNTNTDGNIFDIPVFHFGIAHCGVNVYVRPAPYGSTSGSTLMLGPPPNDGHSPAAWLITPNPNVFGYSLPDWALDVVAYFASPYGHGLSADWGCEWDI